MFSARRFAPLLAALLCSYSLSPSAHACANQQIFPLTPTLAEPAQVGMVGHVNNGTVVDGGSFRAEIVVDQALLDALTLSLANGCDQYTHQMGLGNITLLGIGTGEYTATTEVIHERPGRPNFRRSLSPLMTDTASAATGGVVDHPHDPRLRRGRMGSVRLGDVIAIVGTATASGTIINGWVADQVQVLYTWSNLTPTLDIRLP